MRLLSRLLILVAVLACASASAQAHIGAFASDSKSARREFLPDLGAASGDFARVSARRVWENYDCAREVASALCVDAFGNTIARAGTTDVEHLYRGEQFDPNLGFYYLRARYYDPTNAHFLTLDSFDGFGTDPQSLHKYAFNENDPVNRVDPSGHYSMAEFNISQRVVSTLKLVAISAVIGGVIGAADAHFSGGDVEEGAIQGITYGAMTGPFVGIRALRGILAVAGTAAAAMGMYDAYVKDDMDLLAFRGVLFVAGPTFWVRGLSRSPTAAALVSIVPLIRRLEMSSTLGSLTILAFVLQPTCVNEVCRFEKCLV
jgi:RHS repeat-associated protein